MANVGVLGFVPLSSTYQNLQVSAIREAPTFPVYLRPICARTIHGDCSVLRALEVGLRHAEIVRSLHCRAAAFEDQTDRRTLPF
jgi:hypothetical protein